MSQNAELTIYIGLDGTTPHLYTSESATEPLPSHELVLNEDVACTFKFLLKSSVNDVFASSPSYLQWVGDPPNVSNQSRTDRQVTFTVTNGNSGSGEQSYSFKLFLGTNGEVTILKKGSIPVDPTEVTILKKGSIPVDPTEVTILKKGSIPVDPTIVEKPPG